MISLYAYVNKFARFLFVALFIYPAYGTPLPAGLKNEIISGSIPVCFADQRKNPENGLFSDDQINEYCSCTMNRAANLITLEELQYGFQTKNPAVFDSAKQAAGFYCGKKMLAKAVQASPPNLQPQQTHNPPVAQHRSATPSIIKRAPSDKRACLQLQSAAAIARCAN